MTDLIEEIRNGLIGAYCPVSTPFGDKPLVYADYTASGRALDFIEDYIRDEVLPFYANTHSESSCTGARTTALREAARETIRRTVNAGAEDCVIFCGAGATAAINKLVDILNLRLPRELARRYGLEGRIPCDERPVVFIGPYEHHSNELPWRESIADVITIPLGADGRIDRDALERQLLAHADRGLRIGSFSAASNVSGIRSDVAGITALLKRHGALAFWDYAAAAPYVRIDMNAHYPLDAVFISPHKFVGGPGTPGVLVVKRALIGNSVPSVVGGGTVRYVTPEDHVYLEEPERREEGGTPAIVEAIRAGLVFRLQQAVGIERIERLERGLVDRAVRRLARVPNIELLGNLDAERLSIVSFRMRQGERDLHYGFVVALLNDLFGIQARGGCSCAGPYGHALLGLDMDTSRALQAEIEKGHVVLRPGWVRLSFNYFIDEAEFDYILSAVEMLARDGWRLLRYYHFDAGAGVWRFGGASESPTDGDAFDIGRITRTRAPRASSPLVFSPAALLAEANRRLCGSHEGVPLSRLRLTPECERLRWFVLPQETTSQECAGVDRRDAESLSCAGRYSATRALP